MLKNALVSVAVMAILLSGVLPGEDACASTAPSSHDCCAEPTPEPTSSCCSSMEAPKPGIDTSHDGGCDCIHTPSIPVIGGLHDRRAHA